MLIRGYLSHNEECLTCPISRIPVWPVHPSVYKDALERLKSGIPLHDVKATNRALFASFGYQDMPRDLSKSRYRWLLNKNDHRSLYRQFYQLQGIKVAEQDHINIHEWLDPDSPQFNKTLYDSVFHYSPRTQESDRLEICIATPEMKEAAWKHAHHSQIIVDGTFGISSKKMLLFIVMGVDEANRGVPLAFLLFSAPPVNRKTAAGYDTEILLRLLDAWKKKMGTRNGEEFDVWVVITDTDLPERAALLRVFPQIILLICKFHLRQSWKNHRVKTLKGSTAQHEDIRERLRRLEEALVASEDYTNATALVTKEKETVTALRDSNDCDAVLAGCAIQHIDYLTNYWHHHDVGSPGSYRSCLLSR